MRKLVLAAVLIAMVCLAAINFAPAERLQPATSAPALSAEDQEALELGRGILAIERALKNPGDPNSMRAVEELGRKTRYYCLVRGWLAYQLAGDESILAAAKDQASGDVRERAAFLKKAIRGVDLEK